MKDTSKIVHLPTFLFLINFPLNLFLLSSHLTCVSLLLSIPKSLSLPLSTSIQSLLISLSSSFSHSILFEYLSLTFSLRIFFTSGVTMAFAESLAFGCLMNKFSPTHIPGLRGLPIGKYVIMYYLPLSNNKHHVHHKYKSRM